MKKATLFLMMFLILVLTVISAGPCFAQDADLSEMDNAQLMELLQSIMLQLESEESSAAETPEPLPTPTPTPTAMPVPEADPFADLDNDQLLFLLDLITNKLEANGALAAETAEPVPTAVKHEIYQLKKLMIERLPDYLYIQDEPQIEEPEKEKEKPTPVPGTPCDPKFPNFCFWTLQGGQVVCVCSELG